MSAGLITGEIRDSASLHQLLPEWWDLWWRSAHATPFGTPAWLLAWWDAFCPGELLTITVRRDDRLVGLAPLYLETGEGGGRILPLGISVSDYLDCLLDPADAQSVADAIVAHAAKASVVWDSWEFTDLPPEADAQRISRHRDWTESAGLCSACPVLSLPAEPSQCYSMVPAVTRRHLRMARNRAARRGAVGLIQSPICSVPSVLESLIELHAMRWRTQGEAGVLSDSRVQDFHRAAAPALAQAGLLRLYVLTIGESVAGVYYGFIHRHRAYAYLTGFDPDFAFESPGTILIGHAIDQAAREGAREFDMLRGREPYKYQWGAEDQWTRRRLFEQADIAADHGRAPPEREPLDISAPLRACARGDLPANVALMQLAMAAQDPSDVEAELRNACERLAGGGDEAARARLNDAWVLWQRLPNAFTTVKEVLNEVDHTPGALAPDRAIARCAAAFDKAAGLSASASVALYSLGDADLLDEATGDVVRRMDEWGLLASHHTLLDLGCGNGRFLSALAPSVRFALGIDVSPRMLAAARLNCASAGNTAFVRTSGCDLSAVADDSIDLLCAIDAFPYLVQCGGDLAERHIHEAARILRPAGSLLIINYSYRGSIEADRNDIRRLTGEAGLHIKRDGTRDFTLWDGVTFLLRKRAA